MMKIKTFCVTFVLFVSVFFASLFLISAFYLNRQVAAARENGVNEHHLIAVSMGTELSNMMQNGAKREDAMAYLYQFYAENYARRKGYLEIFQNGELLYGSMPADVTAGRYLAFEPGSTVTVTEPEYVTVSGIFPNTEQEYSIQYSSDISSMVQSWKAMCHMLLVAGIGFSLVVAVVLLFMLNIIFRPLSQVIEASTGIAAGDYEKRITVPQNHDLTSLAVRFNEMAEKVQSAIQALSEDARQKQQFIDNFSHEIRTPLTAVYGFAEYIQKSAITEEDLIRTTGYIMEDSRHILNIADRLLDLATLKERGIIKQNYPVDELYRSAETQLWKRLRENHISLVQEEGIEAICGDKELLQSLLVNLTNNAMDASEAEQMVTWRCYEEDGKVIMSVADQGKGIPEEELGKINEPFYRVNKSRSRENGNAGLGLAICQQIAKAHGADIVFCSELNKGTEVKVIFYRDE